MKKISILLLALTVIVGLTACGRNNDTGATDRTDMTILPTAIPTIETNIPDPEVDTEMPIYTEGTGITMPSMEGTQGQDANSK